MLFMWLFEWNICRKAPCLFKPNHAGWWFGPCFIFPYTVLGIILPIDIHIFQRGRLNHQTCQWRFLSTSATSSHSSPRYNPEMSWWNWRWIKTATATVHLAIFVQSWWVKKRLRNGWWIITGWLSWFGTSRICGNSYSCCLVCKSTCHWGCRLVWTVVIGMKTCLRVTSQPECW